MNQKEKRTCEILTFSFYKKLSHFSAKIITQQVYFSCRAQCHLRRKAVALSGGHCGVVNMQDLPWTESGEPRLWLLRRVFVTVLQSLLG